MFDKNISAPQPSNAFDRLSRANSAEMGEALKKAFEDTSWAGMLSPPRG